MAASSFPRCSVLLFGITLLAWWGWLAAEPRSSPAVEKAGAAPLSASEAAPLLLDGSPLAAKQAPRQIEDNPLEQKTQMVLRPGRMQVGLDVLVHGRPLPTVHHAGRTYVPVPRPGMEYELRVWNHGPRRITAVVSVDGLSVITGEPASEHHPGYVVAPYGQVVIKGWRRSMDTVAAFRFVDRSQSYAALVGKPENIGVIGLVAFEELVEHPLPELEKRSAAAAAKPYRADVGTIGTQYGRDVDSRAYYVPFVRSGVKRTVTLYYDTVDALRKAGVPVDRPAPIPFPVDWQFAPPPPSRPTG